MVNRVKERRTLNNVHVLSPENSAMFTSRYQNIQQCSRPVARKVSNVHVSLPEHSAMFTSFYQNSRHFSPVATGTLDKISHAFGLLINANSARLIIDYVANMAMEV
jgi:hypothetical protein